MREASVFVIAEVGSVHDGSFGNALKLIDVAAEAKADAVKFQTHIAESETLRNAPPPPFFAAESRFEYFRRTAFTVDQWRHLYDHCRQCGIEFMSSPFSEEAVDLLEEIGVRRYKIPSGEVTNIPLLEKIARLGKPVILSSGMSSWDELDRAVDVLRSHRTSFAVLQCTSEYPCPPDHVGLNVMVQMAERYGVPVGLSDHTLTPYASVAAVALGASIIERHLTFSRRMYGSDAAHSLEPEELAEAIRGVRAVEIMRTSGVDKDDIARFDDMKRVFQKSVVTLSEIPAGAVLTAEVVGLRKPGTGLAPDRIRDIVGRRAARTLPAGTILSEDDIMQEQT